MRLFSRHKQHVTLAAPAPMRTNPCLLIFQCLYVTVQVVHLNPNAPDGETEKGVVRPHTIPLCSFLFQDEHSPRCLERPSVKGVEIDAAGNLFSDVVPAVPIGGGFSSLIATRFL